MNIGTLKALLEDIDDDKEVRLVFQQSWPLQLDLLGIVEGNDTTDEDGNPLTCQMEDDSSFTKTCDRYLAAVDEKLFCPVHGDITELALSDSELEDRKRVFLIACDSSPWKGSPYGNKSWWDSCRRYP